MRVPDRTEAARPAALAAGVALVLLGLLHSGLVCLRRSPDADMAVSSVLYEALRRHGLPVLSQWHATQDNWLLSAVLPQVPLEAVLGDPAWLPAAAGWFFFAGSCAIAGLLARPAAGVAGGLLLCGALLCASPVGLTGAGFLAHPASHGVTAFWSLLAVLAAFACLRGRAFACLSVTAAALVVATVSDPWARPAFLLPLSLVGACGAVLGSGRLRRASAWAGVATLPAWLAGSHAFGLLPSLVAMHFDRGNLADVPWRLLLGLRGYGVLFSLVPTVPGDARVWPGVATLGAGGVLLAAGLFAWRGGVPAWRRGRAASPDGLLALFCLLSAAGTLSAFGLSAMPTDLGLVRLLLNAFYVLPLFLAVSLGRGRRGPAALALAAVVFAGAGLASPWMPVREASVSAAGWQDRLTTFLLEHGLHDGYGGYWGTDANSSRLRTGGRVTIRPVSASGGTPPVVPTGSQTFDAWYGPGAGGRDDARFFVAVPDPDLCADRPACRALAIRAFGPPDRTLDWEGYDVLVWQHPVPLR